MINSAEEFVRLRESDCSEEQWRAGTDEAPEAVWWDVLARYPHKRVWVVHNKTVPHSILEHLAFDPEPNVRSTVARKRKLSPQLQQALMRDTDERVRSGLANNKKCAQEVLTLLALDSVRQVREPAERQLRDRFGILGVDQ